MLELKSPAFSDGGDIPKQHTGEGTDTSPPLEWAGVPAGTKELALLCDDPDAPTARPWVHWVVYGISPELWGLPEAIPARGNLSNGPPVRQGENSWPRVGYNGPLPPRGHGWHRYFFTLFALDCRLELPAGATRDELEAAFDGRVLETAVLVGRYRRD